MNKISFKKELIKEKKKILKMEPCFLKEYALWDIEKELKRL